MNSLQLSRVLARKNPYMFKAKHVLTAEQIVKSLVDAHISSGEETLFGDWLEGLAIYINSLVYGGKKSGIVGIDLEFDKDGKRYIVTIKSGPNWGNSSQIEKMKLDFLKARKILNTSGALIQVEAVNGCCYGRDNNPYKEAGYYKYCGQKFWEFISGDTELYTKIVEPLGNSAKERNEDFLESYANMINRFTMQFATAFCKDTGEIDWEKLVKFNSGA